MNGLRLTMDELDSIDTYILAYMDGVMTDDNAHFVTQIIVDAGRFFIVSLIINVYDHRPGFSVVDISESSIDEFLDFYNQK